MTTTAGDEGGLRSALEGRGVDVDVVAERLAAQRVETPSWGYGNSGTRFRVFPQPGVSDTVFEKFEDAAQVHRHTGVCPGVAIHIPWDAVHDYTELSDFAAGLGLHIGAINPNLFQDEDYKLGSVCHPEMAVRRRAIEHLLECIEIGELTSSRILSLWLADGTNYPGQDSFRDRRIRMYECLSEAYEAMPTRMSMLLEYKFFEPAFYHTDLPDWGSALLMCQKLGDRAKVLVDLGHHPHGTNIEQIVALLLTEDRLGGFHFNNRKYADDDLIVGSVNPFELFLIFVELAQAEMDPKPTEIAYMIDQSHNIEPKIEAMILSVVNLQEAYAKALIVDRDALANARGEQDVLRAHALLLDAFNTDVRPLCAHVREQMGASSDPISAFRGSGYMEKIAAAREGGDQAGWG
jgi:L-rhamnose isomerase/sugar isomerase